MLEVHKDESNPPYFLLGAGELAVIHASKIENCVALIDDHKARKIAIQYGIQTVWTMLVFLQALKLRVIEEKTFDSLLTMYIKIASPPISEYQIVLEMKKLLL